MKISRKLLAILVAGWAAAAQAGEIDGRAVVGGAIGGGAGAALGSALGGREGAIIGAGVGAAAGTAVATTPGKEAKAKERVVVEREVIHVHDEGCWPPGHCKHKHKHKH